MPKLYCDLEVRTGRYWATTRKRLTVALPDCILLWAQWKMQLFLCDKHRELSFPVVLSSYEDGPSLAKTPEYVESGKSVIRMRRVQIFFSAKCASSFSYRFVQNLKNTGLGSNSIDFIYAES